MPKGVKTLENELADYKYKLEHHTKLVAMKDLSSSMTRERLGALIANTEKALENAKKNGKGGRRTMRRATTRRRHRHRHTARHY
jgi:GTPase involved in cell partitioning and DNA repair